MCLCVSASRIGGWLVWAAPSVHGFETHSLGLKVSLWEVEAGDSKVPGHPWLPRELEAILGYMSPLVKEQE